MHPVLIRFGGVTLSTYGVLVAAAYLIGILWLKSQISRMPDMDEHKFWILIYALFFGAIMGGKLLFVFLEWPAFASGQLRFFADFRYGFVFFGGLIGAMLMGVAVSRYWSLPYLATADYFGVALPMGHWLGRLGCLAAGCCYGKPTSLPWGVDLGGDPASSTPTELWGVPLHPVQVYESAIVAAIWLLLWRRAMPLVRRKQLPPGTVFLGYVFLYSLARFFLEFFRGDERGAAPAGLSPSQWLSAAGLVGSAAAMIRLRARFERASGL